MVGYPGLLASAPPSRDRGARTRRATTFLLIGALSLTAVLVADGPSAIVVKAIADPFAHSTSTGAALSLTLWMAFALALMLAAPTVCRPLSRWPLAPTAIAFLGAAAVGLGVNMLANLSYLHAQGLPWTASVYHWRGETNTFTHWMHSHAGKAVLAQTLAAWQQRWAPSYDIGAALAGALPTWTGPIIGLSLAAGFCAHAAMLPVIAARFRPAVALAFSLASFNVLKSIVDGGPLTYRCLPALLCVAAVSVAALDVRTRTRWLLGAAAAALLAVYLGGWLAVDGDEATSALLGFASTIGIFAGCLIFAWRPTGRLQRAMRIGAVSICTAVLAVHWAAAWMRGPDLLLSHLPPAMQATVCEEATGRCTSRSVGGDLAFDVYRAAGDAPLKPRHVLLWDASVVAPRYEPGRRALFVIHPITVGAAPRTAVDVAPGHGSDGRPIDLRVLRTLPGRDAVLIQVSSADSALDIAATLDDAGSGHRADNGYVFLHLVAAALRAGGLNEFVMVPLRRSSDRTAFDLDGDGGERR